MSKPVRWSLSVLCVCVAVFLGPLALIVGGNIGGAVINLVLNRKPTISDLAGNYKLDVPWGNSTLQINANGTFEEEVFEGGKLQRVVHGQWQTNDGENFLAVYFRPFAMVWDDDHDRETSIYGINFYKQRSGATYGVVNEDLGESFKRQ